MAVVGRMEVAIVGYPLQTLRKAAMPIGTQQGQQITLFASGKIDVAYAATWSGIDAEGRMPVLTEWRADEARQPPYLRKDRGQDLCLAETGEDVSLGNAGMSAANHHGNVEF